MFAVPRLAIVFGLLHAPEGPLNVDRSSCEFPDLFLPFKNLLRKIRELLLTLSPQEVLVLEMLLCQQEEPANIATKLKEMETKVQVDKLQEKLLVDDKEKNGTKKSAGASADVTTMVGTMVKELVGSAVDKSHSQCVIIDCTQPAIQVALKET